MNHSAPPIGPITVLGYIQAIRQATGSPDRTADPDEPLSSCEICQIPLTVSSAYPAQFGLVRCRQCIGEDGFASAYALEDFRTTGTLSCSGCGHPNQPARVSPDHKSCTYECPACGTTAKFTMRTVA
jgi:hypothetical protein